MPPPHAWLPLPFLLPRRLLSTARPQWTPSSQPQNPLKPSPNSQENNDDFYSLLLSQPLPHCSPRTISKRQILETPISLSDYNSSPNTTTATTSASSSPKISFSMPLAGPSARMRGPARGERGLDRPPEPDNCCMSGCVNCVWEAYREEVEKWALAKRRCEMEEKRREEGMRRHANVRYVGRGERGKDGEEEEEEQDGYAGELDAVGGRGDDGLDVDQEGLFDEVPVGMREFMATEKRLRERRQRRLEIGEG